MTDQWVGKGFGWQNMFVAPEDDPRDLRAQTRAPMRDSLRGERAVLASYLRFQRQTLELKCSGLTPAELATRAVPASELTLLGIVRHMAAVEHSWFQMRMQGASGPRPFRPNDVHSEEFTLPEPTAEVVEEAFAEWRRQCRAAEEYVARTDLATPMRDEPRRELREVIVHMIEEYARHNGHADLLRESIDGRRGQ